ncbi:putative reverse transcriptase domain-containing protein [Tanacetum coccineum]
MFKPHEHKVEEVQYHLYRHVIDISYTKWTKHGEEDEPSINAPKPVNATIEFVDDMDFAYFPTDGPSTVEMVNATKGNFDVDDLVKFQELLLDVEKPHYEGCPEFTKLSAIVKLLNLKGKYGASDKFFTELLGLIKKMLPAGNEMNDKDLTACQTCGTSRWKVDNKTKKVYENIPTKVMWQIPLFKCDWVNHKSGGVKRDKLGYTLVDLNNLGHKVDPFVLASQALQVFYVKDPVDKKLSIIFKTPPKNYKDTYDEVDEEFSTVIHHRNDNVLPLVDRRDLANELRDDYYRKDCGGVVIRKSK